MKGSDVGRGTLAVIGKLRAWALRLAGLFDKARRDRELDEEIESHIELHVADKVLAGMSPQEARRDALLKFGPVEAIKERYRDRRGVPALETVIADVRLGARVLRKNPGYALVTVLTLALGIGGTTAMFSVVDALMLDPFPYPEAHRLAEVHRLWPGGRVYPSIATDVWETLRETLVPAVFTRVEARAPHSVVMTGAADPEEVQAYALTPGTLPLLGARPLLGRVFTESDAAPGAPAVVVLGERLWRRAFGADRGVLGSTIALDGRPLTVIGVLPATFKYPLGYVSVWLPLRLDDPILPVRGYEALVQLGEGVSPAAAQQRIDALGSLLADDGPQPDTARLLSVELLDRGLVGAVEGALWLLVGAVVSVLLIACVNTANLMVVRAGARQGELVVRRSLGATGARLVQQLMTESLLLALAGGSLGILLADSGVNLVVGLLPNDLEQYTQATVDVDGRVLAFGLLVTVITGVAFGAAPAFRAARRSDLAGGSGRSVSASRSARRTGGALVVAELAVSTMLLIGVGLLGRSFVNLLSVDPGFRPEGLVILQINLATHRYPDDARAGLFYAALKNRLLSVPGVRGVAISDGVPPRPAGWRTGLVLETEDGDTRPTGALRLPYAVVDADYFDVLEIPFVAGRSFGSQDTPSSPPGAIVDPDLAELLWPGERAVGRRFRTGPEEPWLTVVGVAGDVKLLGPDDRRGPYVLYYAASQQTPWRYRSVAVRGGGNAAALIPEILQAVRSIDPQQPILDLTPADVMYAGSFERQRFILALLMAFAVVAVVLAAIGVNGVISSVIAQRTRELGIRMALGATPASVVGRVLGGGVALAGLGAAAGTIAALALSRFLVSLLFGVEPTDPTTLVVVSLVLVAVAAASAVAPALRAGRVSPLRALHIEL